MMLKKMTEMVSATLLVISLGGCASPDVLTATLDDQEPTEMVELDASTASSPNLPPRAGVTVTTMTRIDANEGGFLGPWDEVYVNIERLATWTPKKRWFYQKPKNPKKNAWKFNNIMNAPHEKAINTRLWGGHLPEGKLVTVHVNFREHDSGPFNGGGTDDLGHIWVDIRNQGGRVTYGFYPGKHAKYEGVEPDGSRRFRLHGSGAEYVVHILPRLLTATSPDEG